MKNSLSWRQYIVMGLFILVGIIYIVRLLFLQVFDDSYSQLANRNALRFVTQYPARGLIYSRDNELLVYNELVYDLMVTPHIVKDIDTNLFCQLLGIDKKGFIERMQKAVEYSRFAPSIFEKQISKESFGAIHERLYQFHGFYPQTRTLRHYPHGIACHALGYIGEVSQGLLDKNPYYAKGDYIGMSGLEKSYEEVLRGKKGNKVRLADVLNREQGSFRDGEFDTLAISGENLYTTLDLELQKYAEKIMQNKRGSIVAIEPSTGEILCFVSSPFYDPNLLVGRVRSKNYNDLVKNISKPLFNRALMAEYAPGSIFKVAQAMVALDMNKISPYTGYPCDKGLVGCHDHPNANSPQAAIKYSCNPYFYKVYQAILQQKNPKTNKVDVKYGLSVWREKMIKMGFGTKLEIDLPDVKRGYIPDTGFYNRWYNGWWNAHTIFSNSIGQGEVEIIPLQMTNFAAIVANKGWYITPHLVRNIGSDKDLKPNPNYLEKHLSDIPEKYWDIAVDGMWGVVHEDGGTARRARIDDIEICGKTGTVENAGEDHSVFICFAPKKNPQIAVSVYIENAKGGGGAWAAPIASLIVEKYIRKEVLRTEFENIYMTAAPCQPLKTKK